MKNLTFLMLAVILACLSCKKDAGLLNELGKLDHKEISALEYTDASGLWALEDSGNDNKLYSLDEKGKTIQSFDIKNARNNDWEGLAADSEGNLYIGDFGNNDNDRRNLAIYKVNSGKFDSVAAVTRFTYPEQKAFPPKKSERMYDVEAFFEHGGNFYLFTKNRSKGFDGSFYIYKVPNKPGSHKAKLLATMKTCGHYNTCAVTGADISPDGTKAVLLSGGKVWLLNNFGDDEFAKADMKEIDLGHVSQKEGICFKDNNTLLVADEEDDGMGGRLYELKLPN